MRRALEVERFKKLYHVDIDNEANFDFLDYEDHEGNPLATLHYEVFKTDVGTESERWVSGHKSIFPRNSYNNKLTVHNLKRNVLKKAIKQSFPE